MTVSSPLVIVDSIPPRVCSPTRTHHYGDPRCPNPRKKSRESGAVQIESGRQKEDLSVRSPPPAARPPLLQAHRRLTTSPRRPNHVITFIRPKPNQPANHATFVVPVRFNKLDLRDYLFHVYNVRVKGVRSFINHIPTKATASTRWSRGKPQKMMIADLVQPFHWPEPPAMDEREKFDFEQYDTMDKWVTEQKAKQQARFDGKTPLQSKEPVPESRTKLRQQMDEFLANPELWKEGGRPLQKIVETQGQGGWEEVEEDIDFAFDDADAQAAERKAEGKRGDKP